jgi:ABC-type nickel/cobalt efflux system permease component RcnA
MLSLLSMIALGFILGMRHATDPDHVIAVATIVTRHRKIGQAAVIGAVWGVGHTLTVFVVGAGIIFFNLVISQRAGLAMELSVGAMLVALGLWNLSGFRRLPTPGGSEETARDAGPGGVHAHFHSHGDRVHSHPHDHLSLLHSHPHDETLLAPLDRILGRRRIYQHIRPFGVGVVHGLAGSAAVALLILSTIHNPHWAAAYLLLFGGGTIAGMMLITVTMASSFRLVGTGKERFSRGLRIATGLVSLAFGAFITYQICFTQGLLTGHPRWIPR